jgi:hypothetical protein
VDAVVDFAAFFYAFCKLHISLHLSLQARDSLVQLAKVVVNKQTSTSTAGTSADHETFAVAG